MEWKLNTWYFSYYHVPVPVPDLIYFDLLSDLGRNFKKRESEISLVIIGR